MDRSLWHRWVRLVCCPATVLFVTCATVKINYLLKNIYHEFFTTYAHQKEAKGKTGIRQGYIVAGAKEERACQQTYNNIDVLVAGKC